MPEWGPSGSVRGALSNERPYRDSVRDLALLLWDVVASVLVQLEGQGGHPGSGEEPPCYFSPAPGATGRIRATTCLDPEEEKLRFSK